MAIDNATIEKLIEKAKDAKEKIEPNALNSILNNSKINRLKTPNLSSSGLKRLNCCSNCKIQLSTGNGQGPYLVLEYNPEADKWGAQSTKNPLEIFLADLTFPGLIAPGFILPGWHTLGEPYGLLMPKRAGKAFETIKTSEIDKDKYIDIIIEIGFTGNNT